MRITNKMMVDTAIQRMADNIEAVSKLETKVSTGKEFQVASENPLAASKSLTLRSHLRTLESYAETAAQTQNWMTASDVAFDQLENIVIRANEIILDGLNDTISGSERATTIATEMQELLSQALDVGNTKINGQTIFAGYQVDGSAFELVDDPTALLDYEGNPFTGKLVNYIGDTGAMQRNIGPDHVVTLNVRGDQAVQGFLDTLSKAYNALKQDNIHPTGDPLTDPLSLQTVLGELQSALSTMDQFRTSNGARMRQVDSAKSFLETVKTETQSLLSENEDLNMAEGIMSLVNRQSVYEAVLEVSQRAISAFNLFDYLK
jgi:flagellar hook-associated protein 3 FlgL